MQNQMTQLESGQSDGTEQHKKEWVTPEISESPINEFTHAGPFPGAVDGAGYS